MSEDLFFSLQGPLDAIPSTGQVRAGIIAGLGDYVRALNGDPRRIMERHGLDPSALQDRDVHIDVQAFVDVFEHCATAFDEPLFGLRLADRQGPDIFGCVTALCRAAPTIREALTLFTDYIPVIHSPVTTLELVEGKETAELRYAPNSDFGAFDQSNFQAILLNVRLLQQIGGPNFPISYVNLNADARSGDVPEIEKLLKCRFHSAPTNAVGFPARLLDQPTATSDRLLFRLLSGYLDRVKATCRTTLVQRVEDYIRGALASGTCSITRCAKRLGISERTLQAHLNDAGLRFSNILEQERTKLAKSYLEQPDLSLDEVAFRLGYSEQSSFGRAFKRWTGATPQTYQVQVGSRHADALVA
jgi:AraC-like DNA-binding protein